ncbi:serine hydrolase domain-containing protein [Aquiflexum gelatinilyticum]|uniref:Beta-lactamase family protein n=1 Tax=Aquiflexum gelatinilyticum TaxID=2961943 RepID=A0A9X2SXC1_9BACT|nr:serine hydrolase domain-containing protein [Aquiflexum gelatinilyticum]MCR9013607.1 beta-lactamase family protein [Aquiflexum gelatinilyticum]MCS4436895.1 beta-lactamase family protein [Aquiflexum gelatinilyticum]
MTKQHIKQTLRILFILASIGSLYFVPWVLVKAWILPLPDTIQGQMDEAIGYGFDGMIVYVDQKGKQPELYAAGWHDRKKKIPAYPQALFQIASITKLYVAVATAKLVKEGRLSLDKTLAGYFPELAERIEYSDKITLRMMLQHRSGIPNFVDHPDYWTNPPKNRQETLGYGLDLPADFKPDEDYGYSNTNYMLIENLMDTLLGYPHQQYIKEQILIPLGLKNTFGSLSEVNIKDVMSGYYFGIDKDFKNEDTGLMLATAEDVGIFLRALNDGSVFKEGEKEIYSSIYVYEHTGLLPGYQSIAKYHKDIDAVVIQFNNTSNFDGYDWSLAEIIYGRIIKILKK